MKTGIMTFKLSSLHTGAFSHRLPMNVTSFLQIAGFVIFFYKVYSLLVKVSSCNLGHPPHLFSVSLPAVQPLQLLSDWHYSLNFMTDEFMLMPCC